MDRRWTDTELATLRSLHLPPLAARLGYCQDPDDRKRWKRKNSIISINGGKFYDHLAESGGFGAIDLVMHVHNCSFLHAIRYLTGSFDKPQDSGSSGKMLNVPDDCNVNWPSVLNYLTTDRCLSHRLISSCRKHRLIRADAKCNAVFLCTDPYRNVTGAEIVGTVERRDRTRFRMLASGSRKSAGSFWLPVDGTSPHSAILSESAIDSLSIRSIPCLCKPGTIIVSTAGATGRLPEWIMGWNLRQILCAYDADEKGDHFADRLMASNPMVKRLRPQGGKDWNDYLKNAVRANRQR